MLSHLTALDLARAIREKEVSPEEALDESLEAIETRNGALNAVIWHDPEDARARARAAAERISAGEDDLPPFHGVPLPIKDLTTVEGWPATYGSSGASAHPEPESALVVDRLVEAGFVLCGRTNSPEFGTVTATENERYGITRNPWNTDHTSGGSSGGASSAVAGELFTIAHASDGGGSIRIPASCTGLVGLKPSRGRVPDLTVSWEGASTSGVVSHTVADTAAVLDFIGRADPLSWWNAPPPPSPFADAPDRDPGRLRIAVGTETPLGMPVDAECVAAVESAVGVLEDLGHEIVDAGFDPHADEFVEGFLNVVDAGLASYPVDWDLVLAYNRAGRDRAADIDSLTYVSSVEALQRWTRLVNAQWGRDFDVLVTPTMAIQPAPAGQTYDEITSAPDETSPTTLHSVLFTSIFNMSGLPAISLPLHQAADSGLPIGVQLVDGPWLDHRLLALAAQVEAAAPWRDRRPDLSSL